MNAKFNVYKDGIHVVSVLDAPSYEAAFEQMKKLFSSYMSEDRSTWSIEMVNGTRYSLI